jgi:hypothetical protein
MERRALLERRFQPVGLHRRDRGRVERPDPAAQLERPAEGLLERHLLVEHETDQEGDWVLGDEPVGLVVAGTDAQQEFGRKMGAAGYTWRCCRGAAEAIAVIKRYMENV